MKKLNLLTYGIFFAFVLVYWGIKKMGYSIDSHTYLMVMVFVLFLLYVIRKIVLFQKITNKQEPHERAYDDDDTMKEEESVPTNPLDEMKRMDKKIEVKRAVFIILVFVALIGLKYGSRVMIADMLLDGFDTTEEFFADIDRKREFREKWDEYRKEEMKNGGPAYLVEDVFATTLKPDHWKDFFVLRMCPMDFITGIGICSPVLAVTISLQRFFMIWKQNRNFSTSSSLRIMTIIKAMFLTA